MNSNQILEREKNFIDTISETYQYDSNIRHLLYIIIPAFLLKYGMQKETMILSTFRDTIIKKSDKESDIVKAYYSSTLRENHGEYKTQKYMVIQNYQKISLIDLLDNLVHEFNHAINSYVNEVQEKKEKLYLRTGLTYRIYNKQDLSFIKKDPSYILEEIINTKQTEDVINIIKQMDLNDRSLETTIYAINSETNHKYNSNSYYLQSYICKEILNNKTFIKTLENLRINGEIYDIDNWFDDIVGQKGMYNSLITNLHDVYKLELEYKDKKVFKSITLNKIKDKSKEIVRIIEKFNNSVNFR